MILTDHAENLIAKYCAGRGIKIIRGKIPDQYAGEIKAYLNRELKLSRFNTKRMEKDSEASIKNIMHSMTGKLRDLCESPIEDYLYKALEVEGLVKHFKCQFEIGKYRVDFACPIAKLIVECDGKEYHFTEQSQIERDQKRDQYFARKGWRVLHLEGYAIRKNIKLCIDNILDQINPYIQHGKE